MSITQVSNNWIMKQTLCNVLLLHIPVNTSTLQSMLPHSLLPHALHGSAWVSVVLANCTGTRFNAGFSIPFTSYSSLVLRAYVTHNNTGGVHYLAMRSNARLVNLTAKLITPLPVSYENVQFNNAGVLSYSCNKKSRLSIAFSLNHAVTNGHPDSDWFINRPNLYQTSGSGVSHYYIQQPSWPLYAVQPRNIDININCGPLAIRPRSITSMQYCSQTSMLLKMA